MLSFSQILFHQSSLEIEKYWTQLKIHYAIVGIFRDSKRMILTDLANAKDDFSLRES